MRKILGRVLADRRIVGGFLLVVQLFIVMWGVGWMSEHWRWVPRLLTLLSFAIVVWLVRKYDNPMYKISWIIVILALPLFGGLFYLFWGNTPLNRARTQHQYEPKAPDFTDYKTALQELVQQKTGQVMSYEMTGQSGPDHMKVFSFAVLLNGAVIGSGDGRTKKEAEQAAAKMGLDALKNGAQA